MKAVRLAAFLIPLLVGLALVGAYAGGRYVGAQDTIKSAQQALLDLDSAGTAEALVMIGAVRARLREGQATEADAILLRYAALKAPALLDCSNRRTCTQLGA